MKFSISRASDEFMEEVEKPNYPPVRGAEWNEDDRQWEVNINSLESLFIIGRNGDLLLSFKDDYMSVIIQDLEPIRSFVANSNVI